MENPINLQAPSFILGIDVSKDSLDVCLIRASDSQQLCHKLWQQPLGLQENEGLAQAARLRGGLGDALLPGAHGSLHPAGGALPDGPGRAGVDGERPADQEKHRYDQGERRQSGRATPAMPFYTSSRQNA